eukprot:COSAG01_NODE_6959_length_3416_cov_33.694001_1_plen_526_part_00
MPGTRVTPLDVKLLDVPELVGGPGSPSADQAMVVAATQQPEHLVLENPSAQSSITQRSGGARARWSQAKTSSDSNGGGGGARMAAVAVDAHTQTFIGKEHRVLGRALSDSNGEPSTVFRLLQISVVVSAFLIGPAVMLSWLNQSGSEQPNTQLLYVAAALTTQAFLGVLPVMNAVRGSLLFRSPDDALPELMKVLCEGGVQIETNDAISLRKWRKRITGFIIASMIGLCAMGLADVIRGEDTIAVDNGSRLITGIVTVFTMPFVANPIILSWAYSMKVASCLCITSIADVANAAHRTDPTNSADWNEAVSQPALTLHTKTKTMSDGWGGGLAGCIFIAWTMCIQNFVNSINDPLCVNGDREFGYPIGTMQLKFVTFSLIWAVLPLIIAIDVATISTNCENLMDTLNLARCEYGQPAHNNIAWLETALRGVNSGQGLGFTLFSTVTDRKTLKSLLFAIVGGFTSGYTYLIALRHGNSDEQHGEQHGAIGDCGLTSEQQSTFQSVAALVNASCTWNLTIGPGGVIVH